MKDFDTIYKGVVNGVVCMLCIAATLSLVGGVYATVVDKWPVAVFGYMCFAISVGGAWVIKATSHMGGKG